ncbi:MULTISPECIES: hypothetical protein [unclassified Muribaculum]|uniref:Uncharacterized protein n=1 Tax=Candidatus Merdivivens pullistercoris TaxID=2840873 RepID=A0A9D9N935_9BACT|nr:MULTISPECIES: hypothetical protein [unclassified Muribaculum]MBO8464822.1 hypothetical protein [Candidatus Merdivivens pullistercoris]
MKNIILSMALAVLTAIPAIGQTRIQNCFYGVEIRSSYNEMKNCRELRKVINDKYRNFNWMRRHAYDWVNNKEEKVRFSNMSFGGRRWAYCEYYFNDDKTFYQIRFYDGAKEPQATRRTYDNLLKDLKSKYHGQRGIEMTEDILWEDDLSISTTFTGNNGMTCELRYSYEAASSGEMYYYVFLTYYDQKLKKEAKYGWLEEL